MHEISLMSNILDTLRDNAADHQITRITEIHLIIGKFAMVLPDSLKFAFEALRAEEVLFKDAELSIEEKELECLCNECEQTFAVGQSYAFVCPHCNSSNLQIISGRELSIGFYEGD